MRMDTPRGARFWSAEGHAQLGSSVVPAPRGCGHARCGMLRYGGYSNVACSQCDRYQPPTRIKCDGRRLLALFVPEPSGISFQEIHAGHGQCAGLVAVVRPQEVLQVSLELGVLRGGGTSGIGGTAQHAHGPAAGGAPRARESPSTTLSVEQSSLHWPQGWPSLPAAHRPRSSSQLFGSRLDRGPKLIPVSIDTS